MYFELHTCHVWCQNEVITMQKAKTDIIAAYDKPSLLIDHFEGCMGSNKFKPTHFCNL